MSDRCDAFNRILVFFKYDHLPAALQATSRPFSELAHLMVLQANESVHPAEVMTGLRKLLESKDCFVRSRLPSDATPIPKDAP